MNIIIVLHSHICGGAEKHALAMMVGLQSQGHSVAFAGPADSWLAENADECGIQCFDIALTGYFDLLSLFRLCRAARIFGADILHGHLTRGAYYAGLASRLTGRIGVATAHLMNSHKRFHWTTRIIAVSDAVRDYLIEHRYRPDQIAVIRNGIEVPPLEATTRSRVRSEWGLGISDVAVGMVSRLAEFKGHGLVLDALSRLANPNVHLFILGKTEGVLWYDVLRDRARELGITPRVHFLGHCEDVSEMLSGMDIFLSASRREAFPTSVLEACACGLPVIASRVGGTGEIIRDRENGVLFESGDTAALVVLLGQLAADATLRQRLGDAALIDVRQRFSIGNMIESTLHLYQAELQTFGR